METTGRERLESGLGKMNPGLEVTTVVVLALALAHVQTLSEKSFGPRLTIAVFVRGESMRSLRTFLEGKWMLISTRRDVAEWRRTASRAATPLSLLFELLSC